YPSVTGGSSSALMKILYVSSSRASSYFMLTSFFARGITLKRPQDIVETLEECLAVIKVAEKD
ncbi:hypothetical protein ACLOJK_036600, partial [Asimina triloba]